MTYLAIMWVGGQNSNSYLGELLYHQPLLTAFHHVQCISQISLARNKKIRNSLTLFVAPPTPSKTAFIFWTRESSLHLTFIRIPYAIHKGITCLPSFPFNFGTATVAMISKTSGARSLISVRMLFQWNSTRFLWHSEGTRRTDGWELFLAQSMAHWASTSLKIGAA